MGWLSGLVRQEREEPAGAEQRSLVSADELADLVAGVKSATGRTISEETALRQVTVFACVSLIAETVGALPLFLYRRLDRGKAEATEHPLYTLLHDLPNPELTAQELIEYMTGHLLLWGNAYCEIEFDRAGRRRALWPLRPDCMTVDINARNERVYEYTLPDGKTVRMERWRVWHVRGWATEAWVGKSRIAAAREAIGLALATEEFGGRFFGNDSRPGGILRHPGKLSQDAAAKLKTRWEEAHRGLTNSQRVAVLEEGIEWQAIGIPPNEAQFLETRKFQEEQVCQIFRVPPHMVGITDRSTSWGTGIEQQSLGFQRFSLKPYLRRFRGTVYRDLLSGPERSTYFAEFLTNDLVSADLNARYQAYNVGRLGGWLSVNDIREAENMNPVDGGDEYLRPLNMAPLGSEPEGDAAATDDTNLTNEGDDDDEAQAD